MEPKQYHSLVYPVGRVTPDGVSLLGTCFLLNKMSCFATACHVTNNFDKDLVICITSTDDNGYQDTGENKVQTVPVRIIKSDPIHDICILKCEKPIVSNIRIQGTDSVGLCDDLIVLGYPHCTTNGRHVLTCQDATVGAKILIANEGIKTKNIVINIQSRPGQSGSPVFCKHTKSVVAMLIGSYAPNNRGGISLGGIDPQTLHQTTHAISAEYILNMI